MTDNRGGVRRDVIGLFNWDDKQPGRSTIRWIASGCRRPSVSWPSTSGATGSLPPLEGRLKVTLPPSSCMILAVRPEADHPQVISTSRHVTQGMVDLLDRELGCGNQNAQWAEQGRGRRSL